MTGKKSKDDSNGNNKTLTDISPKSTKQDILDAYNKLLEQRNNQVTEPSEERKKTKRIPDC